MSDTPQEGYTPLPHWFTANMHKWGKFPSVTLIALVIARHTYGWRKEADRISLSQFQNETGLTRQGVINAIAQAVELGVIRRTQVGNLFDYSLVNLFDYPICSQSTELTRSSQITLPEVVNSVDTQYKGKKERKKSSSATSVTLPAPAEKKPKREPANPLALALFDPLMTISASPKKQGPIIAARKAAKWLAEEYQATPEQVSAFWDWFRKHTPAAQQATKERRQVNPPTLKQVTDLWPQFLSHWQAAETRRQADEEQEREAREAKAIREANRAKYLERQRQLGLVA